MVARRPKNKHAPGQVRIIAGQWRGRRLPVPDLPGLRPTADRARETLFNWLAPWLPGARCLDLFAGTGALGLEAASRGAASVTIVEKNAAACGAIRESIAALDATQVEALQADAMDWLSGHRQQHFDIVFADPPFTLDLDQALIDAVEQYGAVRPAGFVYLEMVKSRPLPLLPPHLQCYRDRTVGNVRLLLLRNTLPD